MTMSLKFVELCLTIIVLCVSIRNSVDAVNCAKINSCSCKNDDGTYIDLSPLADNSGNPHFMDVDDQSGEDDHFSWNPCNGFTEGSCSGVAVCQKRQGFPNPLYFNCGTQDSADFLDDGQGRLMLQYSADTDNSNVLRTSNIVLTCDQNTEGNLVAKGEQGSLAIYDFELTSKHACPRSGPPPGPNNGSSGLSAGWILVIIFISFVAAYMIFGIAIQVGVRKKRGVESIPNSEFWTGLPSTIKAGVLFTVQRGKVTKSYDSV